MDTEHGVAEIAVKYKKFYSQIFEVFEDYLFIEFYYPELHKLLKEDKVGMMRFESATSSYKAPFKKEFIYGVIDRTVKKTNPFRSLYDAVALTEGYLQDITNRIYRDNPSKLETKDEAPDQQFKLLKVITSSVDKSEIISRIAEEKIRGIFYGNPVDFFKKDKAKIGLGKSLADNYPLVLDNYAEIIARRNLYTHNSGKVDRKYIREIKNTSLNLGEKAMIDKSYIKNAIEILHGISTIATKNALLANYNIDSVHGKLEFYSKRFDKKWKGK
jgi:hypothetical protein